MDTPVGGTEIDPYDSSLSERSIDLHLDHIVLRASVAAFSRLDASKQPA